jgi:dihydropyrimidine dehydrogenase (NAD+) subunit PreT
MGLSGVNALRANGETREGVEDAVEFISDLRQAGDLGALPVGRNVVVIGGGMTAIDAAVQSKLLGAESVTILYRRGREAMPASVTSRTSRRPRACASSSTRCRWKSSAMAR